MSDLRLILLVLGGLFIIGLYCREVFFRSEPKRKNAILDAVDDIPDLPGMDLKQTDDSPDYSRSLIDLGNMIAQSRKQTDLTDQDKHLLRSEPSLEQSSQPPSLSVSTKPTPEETASFTHASDHQDDDDVTFSGVDFDLFAAPDQGNESAKLEASTDEETLEESLSPVQEEEIRDDAGGSEDDEDAEEHADEDEDDSDEERQLGQSSDDIIVLYVTSPAQTLFNGLSISKAADEVGMVYGHMNVFHHFGPGKLHSGQPLFSMANMFEPGSFDLGRMADLKTKGVVMFMYSPASIEAKVVFELFLNTAQRVAELLNGELRTQDNRVLSSTGIQSLRMKAESLSDLS